MLSLRLCIIKVFKPRLLMQLYAFQDLSKFLSTVLHCAVQIYHLVPIDDWAPQHCAALCGVGMPLSSLKLSFLMVKRFNSTAGKHRWAKRINMHSVCILKCFVSMNYLWCTMSKMSNPHIDGDLQVQSISARELWRCWLCCNGDQLYISDKFLLM